MENPIIMAIGLDYTGEQELQNKELASVKEVMQMLNSSLPVESIEYSKGMLTFKDYDEAEKLINKVYSHSEEINKSLAKEKILYFYVVLMINDSKNRLAFATAINMLNGTIAEKQESLQNYHVRVYVTGDVYKGLKPEFQDMYHSSVEVAGKELHQRFFQDAQRCFVISPIGDEGSPIRTRADYVFDTYIKPACEGTPFRAVRGDMMTGPNVVPELMAAIQSDPLVIAYVGHCDPKTRLWNANVMLELGGRLGNNNAPCVVLKDSTAEGLPNELPFDMKDIRVVEIPEQNAQNLEQGAVKIRTIRDAIFAVIKNQWKCHYPVATVDIKIGAPNDGKSKYTEASMELDTLFDMKQITGREVLLVLNDLMEKMPECQREPFINEQRALIAGLILGDLGIEGVHATVPIVFEKHTIYQGQAFLPIIVRHSFNNLTNTLRLSVIYMNVTEIIEMNEDGHWICKLAGKKRIDFNDASKSK